MKLNRAYSESLDNSLKIIQDVLMHHINKNSFIPKEFTEAIKEKQIKYANQ